VLAFCINFQTTQLKPSVTLFALLQNPKRGTVKSEKEGLAIIFATTKFYKMIFGRRFTLQTDHKPLLTVFGHKNSIPIYTANRLQRWALQLLTYDFQIQYIKTTEFGHADILSRLINQQYKPEEKETVIASIRNSHHLSKFVAVYINHIQAYPRSNQGGPYYATGNTIYTIS